MKILRLTTLLDFGGQEKQYISFTERPELLHNTYIFAAIGHGGRVEKTLKERGFEVYVLGQPVSVKNLSNIYAIYKLIKRIQPDIVHTAVAEANFHGIIAAKMAGVKTIVAEEVGIPNHSPIAKKIFHFVYRFADKVIGVSKAVIQHLVKTREIAEGKGHVIYNPVSIPTLYPQESNPYFHIVYVGRLEKVKNVETLISAVSKIGHQDFLLTIVGDGREMTDLKQLVARLNLNDRVKFAGYSAEPSSYLSDADLFVLPSYSEGFGIAAVEAMFLRIPVLCSNVGGIPEFISHNENGWLFDPNSVSDLVNKLDMIMDLEEKTIKSIAEKGYESVIQKFTIEKYILHLENLYDEIS